MCGEREATGPEDCKANNTGSTTAETTMTIPKTTKTAMPVAVPGPAIFIEKNTKTNHTSLL